MSSSYVLLANLIAVCCSNTAKLRLLRFSEARNVRKCGELMSVNMLLLDEQDNQLNPEWEMIRPDGRVEKWVLHNAFNDEDKPYLPKDYSIINMIAKRKSFVPSSTSHKRPLTRRCSLMTIPLNNNNNKPLNASPLLATSLPSTDIARPSVLESMAKKK